MKKLAIICAALIGTSGAASAQQPPPAVPPNEPYSANQYGKATELSGKLNSVDRKQRSLTISLGSGQRQLVKLADSATITRDGATAGLDQLKPGDEVRATYDPAAHLAIVIKVQSAPAK